MKGYQSILGHKIGFEDLSRGENGDSENKREERQTEQVEQKDEVRILVGKYIFVFYWFI